MKGILAAGTVHVAAWILEAQVVTVASEAELPPRNIQTRADRERRVHASEVRFAKLVQMTLEPEPAR